MLVSDLVSDENKTRVYRPLQIKNFFRIFLGVSDSNVTFLWCHIYTQLRATALDKYLRARHNYRALNQGNPTSLDGRQQSSGSRYRLSAWIREKVPMSTSCPEYSEPMVKTILETAKALQVSRSTIYRLINSGELEVTYVLSSPRITSIEIERYLRRQLGRQRRNEVRGQWH
jgi:excisionase family DNA binding protein